LGSNVFGGDALHSSDDGITAAVMARDGGSHDAFGGGGSNDASAVEAAATRPAGPAAAAMDVC